MLYDPKHEFKSQDDYRARIYDAAADAIEKHGHVRGLMQDARGRMCLWGALNFVMFGNAIATERNTVWPILLQLQPFTNNINPILWNNDPARRKSQVIKVLRKAARAAANV